VTLTGSVTKMAWINPHSWIYIDVKKPDGTVENWAVEAGPPGTLIRAGFTRDSLAAGTVIKVNGYRAKDGESNNLARWCGSESEQSRSLYN